MRNTLVYLQTHFREKLTVEQVADAMHFSKSYFSHTFKELTHLSLVGYINALRCQHARALILEGASLAAAAAECGFADLSYFTRVFKKLVGVSPSTFRSHYNLGTDPAENRRLTGSELSAYDEILGVKILPLDDAVQALLELGRRTKEK